VTVTTGAYRAAVDELTPQQAKVVAALRQGDRRQFSPSLARDLRSHLEDELAPYARMLADRDDQIVLSKRSIEQLHTCEAFHVADENTPFQWSVPVAKGTIAHRAVELAGFLPSMPSPAELAENTIGRLAADASGSGTIADFLITLTDTERAELTSEVTALVSAHFDGFPPLPKSWKPVYEGRVRAELCVDRITLAGKVDLTIGTPQGNTAGRVLVDLKTGRPSATHLHDLRFYALLETLRSGVPPFRLASYYLDSGALHPEDVDESVLEVAVRRVIDAVDTKLALMQSVREPATTPGPQCRWCPIAHRCPDALDERDTD